MINVSQAIKNSCKADKNTHREYIIIDNQTIDIKGKLSATAYKDTSFIGTFNMKVLQFEAENTTQFRNKEFEYYKEIDGNSFKIGTFITTEVVDNDSTGMIKVTANDYGLKFAVPYTTELNYSSNQITLFQVLQECCTKAGVTLKNQTITNGSFIVDSNQFVNGELIGDVISSIAGISCNFATITDDDKLELLFFNNTDEVLEDYSDLDDKRDTQPITSVAIGFSQIDGEDVIRQDQSLIEEYGEHWLRIYDNPFAYSTDKFPLLIDAIFNKVKGFGYSSFKSKYTYRPYLTLGDKIKFKNKNGDLIDSIILRYEFNYDDCTFEAPSVTNSTIEYQKTPTTEELLKRAEIRIDQEISEVDIRGKTINLTSDTINIVSTNFSVDKDGNITANSGDIGGFHIGQDSLWNSVEEYATWQSASGKTYKYNMNDVLGAGTYSIRYGPSGDAPQEFLEQYGFSTTAELIDKWDATLDGQVRINDVMKIATFVENSYASNISLNAGQSGSPANIVLGGVHSTEAVKITSLGEITLKDDYNGGSVGTKTTTLSPTGITSDGVIHSNKKIYQARIGPNYSLTWSNAWTVQKLDLDIELFNTLGITASGGDITIPSGVSQIRLYSRVAMANNQLQGDKGLRVYVNGVWSIGLDYTNSDDYYNTMQGETYLNVNEGDVISIYLMSGTAGTMQILEESAIMIEAI